MVLIFKKARLPGKLREMARPDLRVWVFHRWKELFNISNHVSGCKLSLHNANMQVWKKDFTVGNRLVVKKSFGFLQHLLPAVSKDVRRFSLFQNYLEAVCLGNFPNALRRLFEEFSNNRPSGQGVCSLRSRRNALAEPMPRPAKAYAVQKQTIIKQ